MTENYQILKKSELTNPQFNEQIFSIWGKFIPNVPYLILTSRLSRVVLAILHTPSNKIIGFSAVRLKMNLPHKEFYYDLELLVEEGYSDRPLLLEKTLMELQNNRTSHAKGVMIFRKNEEISDEVLQRYGFTKQKENLFYRDFE